MKYTTTWSASDYRQAAAQGWYLGTIDDGDVEIQVEHDAGVFATNNEAIVHVLRKARDHDCGVLERKALAYLRFANGEYFQEVVLDIAQRLGL